MRLGARIATGVVVAAAGMSALFYVAFDETVAVEGGYSHHVDDLGGVTMWGVTEAVAREWGYRGEMRDMPRDTAAAIYHERYWQPLRGDDVGALYEDLALRLFDAGFNTGTYRAGAWLQRCLNVNNAQGSRYRDITVDGRVGAETLRALRSYAALRGGDGEDVLIECIQGLQVAHYVRISEARGANETFTYGWLRRVRR
ncbi:MAG: glycoside hydrolase family 108 protein [Gemmatimonadales bacterium]